VQSTKWSRTNVSIEFKSSLPCFRYIYILNMWIDAALFVKGLTLDYFLILLWIHYIVNKSNIFNIYTCWVLYCSFQGHATRVQSWVRRRNESILSPCPPRRKSYPRARASTGRTSRGYCAPPSPDGIERKNWWTFALSGASSSVTSACCSVARTWLRALVAEMRSAAARKVCGGAAACARGLRCGQVRQWSTA
jgi:hypothetical protein